MKASILFFVVIATLVSKPSFACSEYIAVGIERHNDNTVIVILNTASGNLKTSTAFNHGKKLQVYSMGGDIQDSDYSEYLTRNTRSSSGRKFAGSSDSGGVCGNFSMVAVKNGVVVVNSRTGEVRGVTVN